MFRKTKHRNRSYLRVGSSEDSLQDDTNQYRCKVCGQICDKRRVDVSGPRPNASREVTGIKMVTDGNDKIPTVIKGCPLCGTMYSRRK
jgi:hypothetical protein